MRPRRRVGFGRLHLGHSQRGLCNTGGPSSNRRISQRQPSFGGGSFEGGYRPSLFGQTCYSQPMQGENGRQDGAELLCSADGMGPSIHGHTSPWSRGYSIDYRPMGSLQLEGSLRCAHARSLPHSSLSAGGGSYRGVSIPFPGLMDKILSSWWLKMGCTSTTTTLTSRLNWYG